MTFVHIVHYWVVQISDAWAEKKKWMLKFSSKFMGISQRVTENLKFLVWPKINTIKADGLSCKRYSKQTE